ncbi:D-alanyl-D-alanine carboxypeptidase family protein [Oscillospiraceae bacterium MB08-C2-2]|nr:D-alanyl-D-alanine carboxypeptidase family protein [Oscillospiraceae bacterium MB08-C2-2]
MGKKRTLFACLTAALIWWAGVFPASAAEPMESPVSTGFSVGAKAAVVMEAQTGRVLFDQNAQEKLPIASTTKIMTALIALEQSNTEVYFKVDSTAILVEGSSMGLQEGDMVSLESLAVGMLLASGNDAANAAAVRIAGSVPAFVEMMNQRATELGMTNTHFDTPSGLDGATHYSTAYDMALLAREALRNETFSAICSQYRMRTQYGNPPYDRWLTNHNKMLNYYEGAMGVKTGFTKKSGRCLVSAAERNGVELITVTLNCPDDWNTHRHLFDTYFEKLQVEDLSAGIPRARLYVAGGAQNQVTSAPTQPIQVPVNADGSSRIEYKVTTTQPFLYAPVTKGQTVGYATVTLDGTEICTITLTASQDVPLLHPYKEKRSLWERFKSNFSF